MTFTRELIALRRAHPASTTLTKGDQLTVRPRSTLLVQGHRTTEEPSATRSGPGWRQADG